MEDGITPGFLPKIHLYINIKTGVDRETDGRNSEIETTARLECRHVQRVSQDTYSVSKICSIWDCYFTLLCLCAWLR